MMKIAISILRHRVAHLVSREDTTSSHAPTTINAIHVVPLATAGATAENAEKALLGEHGREAGEPAANSE
jgi:hypothetical protein